MAESVNIKFWGVRGSTPCANSENMLFGGNTTCFQIEADSLDELLIIDCGTGIRNLGNHLLNGSRRISGRIFITHPHWDHLQGFPFFKPFYKENSWFRVYLPRRIVPVVRKYCKATCQIPSFRLRWICWMQIWIVRLSIPEN